MGPRKDERGGRSGEDQDQEIAPEEPEPHRVKRDAHGFADVDYRSIHIGGPPGGCEQHNAQLDGRVGAGVEVGFAHGRKLARVPVLKPVGLGLNALKDGEDEGNGSGGNEGHCP